MNDNDNELKQFLESNIEEIIDDVHLNDNRSSNEYIELSNERRKLKEKYPKLEYLFENEEIDSLNKEEIKALSKILDIEFKLKYIELKNMFKVGGKYMFYLIKEKY